MQQTNLHTYTLVDDPQVLAIHGPSFVTKILNFREQKTKTTAKFILTVI
jgi:hypothetical protein